MSIIPILCLLLIVLSGQAEAFQTKIGVFAEFTRDNRETKHHFLEYQNLHTFLQENGADYELIFFDESFDLIKKQLDSLSGLIFPTMYRLQNKSHKELLQYLDKIIITYQYAKNIKLPVLGINDGLIMIYLSESIGKIDFNQITYLKGKNRIQDVPQHIQNKGILANGQMVKFITDKGIILNDFNSSPNLRDKFEITSFSQRQIEDENEHELTVASFQSKQLPIYALQFEPQDRENINANSVNFLTYFIGVARKYLKNNNSS